MKTKIIRIAAALLLILCISTGAAAAADSTDTKHTSILEIIKNRVADWTGWTFDKSTHTYLSGEWIADVKEHVKTLVQDRTKSFSDRVKAQAYALGWDDRFDYVEKYGTIDYETGQITYDVPFWDGLFGGLKFREKWFTNIDDYNAAMSVYMDNYINAVQIVPKEL